MKKLNQKEVLRYVETNIGLFHQKRLRSVENLELTKVLKRKNPYLFRAKNMLTAVQIVSALVDAHISSCEETIFGDWLEGLAIFINGKVYGGHKSGINGIDLEFNSGGKRYLVAIKSGPNWGNSSQISKMETDFLKAKKTLRTSGSNMEIVAINGCCYGIQKNPDKGGYFKYCGQKFWQIISGDENFYTAIIEPLGHCAEEKNDIFEKAYAKILNKFTREFSEKYCKQNGEIDWSLLVQLNSKG